MNRTLLLFFLMTFTLGTVEARQSPQALFDEANTLMENGQLNEAMDLYRDIYESGNVSGGLFLNMGITAVQLDSMGLAKFYFLKARDFETTTSQAEQALEYVNSQFSRQSAMLPKLPWDKAIDWINHVPGASGLLILGFLITLCGLVLLYACWFGSFTFSTFSTYIISLIVAGSLLAGLAFYADYVDQRYDEAVLIENSRRVYETADLNSPLVSIAYEGYDLTVDNWKSSESQDWLYVRLGNGQFGWILQDGIKTL